MNRRKFLGLASVGIMTTAMRGMSSFNSNSLFAAPKIKKNVLFIAVDDLRPTLGCYGDTIAITPNIDKIASKGIVFNRAYCQEAVCNPSRSSLLTGRRPDTTKVWDNRTHFRKNIPDVITLPQYFKNHGYHVQSVGKIYHDPRWAQDPESWSVPGTLAVTSECGGKYLLDKNARTVKSWKGESTECIEVSDYAYIDGRVADSALDIIMDIRKKPFFLAVGFRRPHLPFCAPKKYWDIYDREKIAPPANPEKPKNVPVIALHNWRELRGYTDIPNEGPLTPEKIAELRHGYYASTSYIDALIGKLLKRLEIIGLLDNTIIILWGDHGYHLGEHDLWCKITNFEYDTRAPLILADPNQKNKGIKTGALVEFVDIYPTLVDLCDLPKADGLEGISMRPLIDEPNRIWKKAAFSQFPRPIYTREELKYMGYSIRTDKYRYTEWQEIETKKIVARELYSHIHDSLETENLAGLSEYKDVLTEMAAMLKKGWREALPVGINKNQKNPERL